MTIATYGATRLRLIENGYAPCSVNRKLGFRAADEIGAILCIPQYKNDCGLDDYASRGVLALTVTVRDKEIAAVIAKYVGKGGPVRVASDGSETHVIRFNNSYGAPTSQASSVATGESDPAVALDSFARSPESGLPESAIIRLDGIWRGGDLLTVKREALPSLDETAIAALITDIDVALSKHAPAFEFGQFNKRNRGVTTPGSYTRMDPEPWSANGATPGTNHPNPWLPNAS